MKLGLLAVLLPALGFAVGMLVTVLIPGCHCDEGAGCGGRGLNDLVAFLFFGGFVEALGAVMFVFPASFVVAFVVALLTRRQG